MYKEIAIKIPGNEVQKKGDVMASTSVLPFPTPDFLVDEPSLDELFAEPIVQLIMARDHVDVGTMRGKMDQLLRLPPQGHC